MQYELLNPNNCMTIEITNCKWLDIKLDGDSIARFRNSKVLNGEIKIGNLILAIYDITSDGTIGNITQFYKEFGE